jgi:hypothetical protein
MLSLKSVVIFISHSSVTVPNNGDSSALVLMSLLAGDCLKLTTNCLNCRLSTNLSH